MSRNNGEAAREALEDSTFDWGGDDALAPFETLMWRVADFPNLRAAVTGVELLDRVPDWDRLWTAHEWGVSTVPRLRQRLVEPSRNLGRPEWCDDPEFDLRNHLSRVRLDGESGDLRAVLDFAQNLAMRPFEVERPLWEAVLVDSLQDGRAAYVLKLHHSLSDGIGVVQLLSYMHSRRRQRSSRSRPTSRVRHVAPLPSRTQVLSRQAWERVRRLPEPVASASRGLANRLSRPPSVSEVARYTASLRRILSPRRAEPSPLLRSRSHNWRFEAMSVQLKGLKDAAKANNASLNDAFVAAVLGGFRGYHEALGEPIDEMPITFPISIRSEDQAGGNHIAPGEFAGPVGEPDPVVRMRLIGDQVGRIRSEPALTAPVQAMGMMTRLPASIAAKVMGPKMAENDLQISNVPGIRDTVYLAGARVDQLFPYAPLPGCPAMISLVSHGNQCCIGFNLDTAAIAYPDRLMACMDEAFAEVLALAPAPAARQTKGV